MSRGKQASFVRVALAAALALYCVAPASAIATSGSVAATDDLAPDAVTNVDAISAGGVTVTWDLSPSDFVRQSPVGTDFTSGGTFVNVNDVAGYDIWRAAGGGDLLVIGTVDAGVTEFTDLSPVGGTSLEYCVTAFDGGGNESDAVCVFVGDVGEPPALDFDPDLGDIDFGDVSSGTVASESIDVSNSGVGIGSIRIDVEGEGFSVAPDAIDIANGESDGFTIEFSAVLNGVYEGTATIRTNDPDFVEVVLDLTAEITDGPTAPDIAVSPGTVAFGLQPLSVGARTVDLTVTNDGGLPLTGTVALAGDAVFSISGAADFSLDAGAVATYVVTYAPAEDGTYTGEITITSDDPDEPSITVPVTGATGDLGGGVETEVVTATLTFVADVVDLDDPVAVDTFIADLIARIAAELGIDSSRIVGLTLTAGSVIVEFEIAPSDDPTEPTPLAAAADLEATLADTTAANQITDIGEVTAVGSAVETVVLFPQDADGNIIVGWFTRGGTQVGFDDFFAFADRFGLSSADPTYDLLYDIAPEGSPNGLIDFDDFFRFADDFGTTVDNAAEIQAALGL